MLYLLLSAATFVPFKADVQPKPRATLYRDMVSMQGSRMALLYAPALLPQTIPGSPFQGGGGGGTIGGSVAATQVAFGSSTANSIAGSSNLTWDGTTLTALNLLTLSGIFSATAGAADSVAIHPSTCTTGIEWEGSAADTNEACWSGGAMDGDITVSQTRASNVYSLLVTGGSTSWVFGINGVLWSIGATTLQTPTLGVISFPGSGGGSINFPGTGANISALGGAGTFAVRFSTSGYEQNCSAEVLTESSATGMVRIPILNTVGSSAGFLFYTVVAADASNIQTRTSTIRFAASNLSGTETCVISDLSGTPDASITETEDENLAQITSGTLTYAITCASNAADSVDISINAVSSLTQTTLTWGGTLRTWGTANTTAPSCL